MSQEIVTIQGIECYEVEGTAYLKLETVARGLGFTRIANSGNEVVLWSRVKKYLVDLGVHTSVHEDSQEVANDDIATSCDGEELPEFIPENVFYRLAMKARNETAERFQALIADEIIPAIRRHGAYLAPGASPQGAEGAALQAVVQPITAAVELLARSFDAQTAILQELVRRTAGRGETRALPPPEKDPADDNPFADCPAVVKPPGNKARRRWMRTASSKLDQLSEKFGIPSSTVLHDLYQEMEAEQGVNLNEARLKALEEHQLSDCTILTAIFYDKTLRGWFQARVDYYLSPGVREW